MAIGKVKRTVKDRGFGFLEGPNGQDYFFHMSDIQEEPGFSFDSLERGTEVEFEETEGKKGPRAANVSRA